MSTSQILLLALPIFVIELALVVLAIRDLLGTERRVRGGNKAVWAFVILLVSLLGPILYFVIGREDA